jgi:hypothetical protein
MKRHHPENINDLDGESPVKKVETENGDARIINAKKPTAANNE